MNARMFPSVLTTEVRRLMAYPGDFWINAFLGSASTMVVAYFLWQAIFRESGSATIGGFDFPAMVAYYVLTALLSRLVQPNNMTDISDEIYKGEYTRYIIYPTAYLPFKYAQNLAGMMPALVQLAVFAGPAVWFLGPGAFAGMTPATMAMAAVSVTAANLLLFVMRYPIQAIAFWADNVWSIVVMLNMVTNLLGGALVPLHLFPEWAQAINAWLPFRLLYYVPTMTIIGQVEPAQWALDVGLALAWSGVIGLAGHAIWRRGDRVYTGVGI